MMTELQTVETLNCLIERTETPPFYRLTSMRKTSGMGPACANNATSSGNGGSIGGAGGSVGGGSGPDTLMSTNVNENETEHTTSHASAGMIHTKRHSGDDPSKIGYVRGFRTGVYSEVYFKGGGYDKLLQKYFYCINFIVF